ncbi:DJ-1/PfpI family protein [Saccharopolyspora spinosa]|uniref:DJ-1/PfpI family protein n=1 Tax=Saccharopolyspora spinosa TaxID=60894 RepID=A0A2N3YAN9_SACSN|nr:DJ-1/PfpI family protein [Saccharopolyspora spinosa]PKW19921.1 DJ-1/PfpI family protein [Saccharopolyspora spinosa]
MDIAFALYDKFTALDLIGPYETLAGHPDVTPHFVAGDLSTVRCNSGLPIQPTTTFAELDRPDVVVVPGSPAWRAALDDEALVSWLAAVHPSTTWTTSVCTGSLLLAKSGALAGKRATTHWTTREALAELGAEVATERVVFDGKVVTGAGVSAGIDMALSLAAELWGEDTAKMIQLMLEYDPQPPFDTGSPEKAGPALVATALER